MLRKQAEALIGQRVQAWTRLSGVYVGTLESICGSPWRGTVRVTGILEPACHLYLGRVCRRGFRLGETLEVGGVNISPTENEGSPSYLTVLEQSIEKHRNATPPPPSSQQGWVDEAFAKALEKVAGAERRRLETGSWHLGA